MLPRQALLIMYIYRCQIFLREKKRGNPGLAICASARPLINRQSHLFVVSISPISRREINGLRLNLGIRRRPLRAKTKRANGHSLEATITDVNRILIGWFGYFKHSYKPTFKFLDSWIRMRPRGILRRRRGGKGRGRGRGRGRGQDHQRWPNAFFAEQGLFSLTAAHAAVGQSSAR